jgi:uncharacterized membrane protein YbhN (UPF0104 family)
MNKLRNKRFYKVISLLIKTAIFAFSFVYIFDKIMDARQSVGMSGLFSHITNKYVILAFLLMFLNWSLEAVKWKLLVAPLERISFFSSLRSIVCGVTISIFSPNRVGEFAGRIFFLEKADKIQASLSSMIGSMIQLLITVAAGSAAYFILQNKYNDFFGPNDFIGPLGFPFIIGAGLLVAGIVFFLYVKRNSLFSKYKKYISVFGQYKKEVIYRIMLLSAIRYAVFSFQYYLVLQAFGISAGETILFSLIALTFFVSSAVPTFALTEIAVRGATAAFFFGTISKDTTGIIAASMLVWLINLVIPAIIGSVFIWKLKFFSKE